MEALLQPARSEPVALAYTEEKREHFYTNAMRRYERAPHLFIGFPSRYLPNEGQRIEPTFMRSRNGVHFTRWSRAVIPESAPRVRVALKLEGAVVG